MAHSKLHIICGNCGQNDQFDYKISTEVDDVTNEKYQGGRSYLLSYEELVHMVFDYMPNTLKWSESDYDDRIWNTIDFTDEILDKYNNIS